MNIGYLGYLVRFTLCSSCPLVPPPFSRNLCKRRKYRIILMVQRALTSRQKKVSSLIFFVIDSSSSDTVRKSNPVLSFLPIPFLFSSLSYLSSLLKLLFIFYYLYITYISYQESSISESLVNTLSFVILFLLLRFFPAVE